MPVNLRVPGVAGKRVPAKIEASRFSFQRDRPLGRPDMANPFSVGTTPHCLPEGMMAWFSLVVAGIMEICWAIGLKSTDGFTRFWPSVWTAATIVLSMVFLAIALRTIPVGTGYAVWTGIGTLGTAIVGMALLGEPVNALRILCLLLIVTGILGLKFSAH